LIEIKKKIFALFRVMNPIITTVLISYGATFFIKYAFNAITEAIFTQTTKVVSTGAKIAWNKITEKDLERDPIEWELVDIDRDDEIVYVTSKPRKLSINEDWTGVDGIDYSNVLSSSNNDLRKIRKTKSEILHKSKFHSD
jgi:hypothetical protein